MPLLTLFCAAAVCLPPQDPVRVSASLTQSRITVGATTTLQVTVETRGAPATDIGHPALAPQLQILGTSDFSHTQISVPGGRSRVTRREFVLLARSEGVYRIPPITIVVDGARYRTQPLDLIVRAGAGIMSGAPTSFSSSLRVTLQPDTVFVGEQVLLHAEVTFSEDMRARQSRPATFDPPAPSGFWIQDVPDPITIALRVREGRTVETQTYRRAYFPLTPGEVRFPPARLHYEVRRGLLYAPESRELVSDSARLVVLPLPDEGRPASFTGAVGRLAMDVRVQPAQVRAGEALVLLVELQGIGNVKALPQPRLPQLDWAEIFPPAQESTVEVADDQVGGTKRFRWVLVPAEEGSMTIPPIEYSVFDPELRTYVTLRSDAHTISVEPAVSAAADSVLRGLRTSPRRDPLAWIDSPAFVVLQAAPLLLLLGAARVRRQRLRPPSAQQQLARIRRSVQQLDAGSATFLTDLERLLREAAAVAAGAAADSVEAMIAELRHVRYAPDARVDREAMRRRTLDIVASLSPRRRWRMHGSAGMLSVVALSCGLDAQQDAFERGVMHYGQREFVAAAQAFQQHVRAHGDDANGWYDLGLASYRAGDRGRAVWAWLRAARLAPRDAAIQHNLRAAGAADALRAVLPPDRLTRNERWLLASLAWWLVAAAASAALLRRRRLLWTALPGAIVWTAMGVVLLVEAARPHVVTPVRAGASLYAAPTVREEVLGELQPGEIAAVLQIGEQWVRVREADGTEGWVERAAVATP